MRLLETNNLEIKRCVILLFLVFITALSASAQITENEKYLVSKTLNLSELIQLDDDYFLVKSIKEKKWGVFEISVDGENFNYHKPLLSCKYDTIEGWFNNNEPFLTLKKNNKYGMFLNPFEQEVREASINLEFDSLISIRKDDGYYAIAKKKNRWGYVDWQNNTMQDFNYNSKGDILKQLFSDNTGNDIRLVFQHPELLKPNEVLFSENKHYMAISEIDLAYGNIVYSLYTTNPPALISSNKIELEENKPVIEAISNDGKYFRIGCYTKNRFIAFYDVNAEKLIYGNPDKIKLDVQYLSSHGCISGNYEIDWRNKETLRIVNNLTKIVRNLDNKIYGLKDYSGQRVQISPDGQYLGIYENKVLRIWDTYKNEIVWTSPKQSFFTEYTEFALLSNNIVASTKVLENQKDAHLYWFDFIKKKVLFSTNYQTFNSIHFVSQFNQDLLIANIDSGKNTINSISKINLASGAFTATKPVNTGFKEYNGLVQSFLDSLKKAHPQQFDYYEKNRQSFFSWYAMYAKYFNENGTIKDSSQKCQLDVSFFEPIKTHWLPVRYEIINALDNKACYQDISDQIEFLVHKSALRKELLFWNGNKVPDERKVTMLYTKNGAPFFYTHDGYYFGSKEIAGFLRFAHKGKSYAFEQFDLKFNRPDIILDRLGYADSSIINFYRKAYYKRLQKYGFDHKDLNSDRHTPEVHIANEDDLLKTFTQKELIIRLEASDSIYKLNRINVWINDVPVFGVNGIDISKLNKNNYKDEISIQLSHGRNKIQVSAHNNNAIESLKETFYVDYQEKIIQKPDLYFITIGISKYVNPMNNLAYADKDARDLVQMFKARSDIYKNIRIIPLLNHNATKAGILSLKDSLMNSKTEDHVILFYAGHGTIGDDGQYYICNTDIRNDNIVESALPYMDFEAILDGIPARNKLLLIDACHSGEADDEDIKIAENSPELGNTKALKLNYIPRKITQSTTYNSHTTFDLMKSLFSDLRRNTGATIIASAGAGEFAYEGGDISNGVFTYFLIEALKSKQADYNKDNIITVSELVDFISIKVQEHTSGKQNPGRRSENLTLDFEIW
ncbi:MAG: caspase family protein [Bacteroidales bacterium]